MKKIILTTTLALLSLFTFAQDFTMTVYKVEIYSFNTIEETWSLYKTTNPIGMQLFKHGTTVYISNVNDAKEILEKIFKKS